MPTLPRRVTETTVDLDRFYMRGLITNQVEARKVQQTVRQSTASPRAHPFHLKHGINNEETGAKFLSDSVGGMLQFLRPAIVAVAAAGVIITTAACGGSTTQTSQEEGAPAAEIIRVDGSSTVFPISEAMAEEFEAATGSRVTVGISGTGGGFQKFCRSETDISDASRPIRAAEIEACKAGGVDYIELPVAYDGLAVVVNPKNTWANAITVEELKKLWQPEAQGKITRWNQIRSSWPDREIHLFGAGVDSGTFDYFTEAINGKEKASRGDFTSSEDDNVLVQGIASDEVALGFMPLAYVEQNKGALKLVPVDDGKPENGNGPITPSAQTVRDGTYQPLSRPLFIYVARKAADRAEVVKFVETFFTSPELIREVGYVELTPQLYDLAKKHFTERKLGSAFATGGSQVGMTLEKLLAREQ
jgi:phosphate transport system substrate-binding protein